MVMNIPSPMRKDFPSTLLANKSLFPSRLSCENSFGELRSGTLVGEIRDLFQFLIVFILMLAGLGTQLVRGPKPKSLEKQADLLILSHYVGLQAGYLKDPFLGEVGQCFRNFFSSITFFLNSTKEKSALVQAKIRLSFSHDFLINSRKIRLFKFLILLKQLLVDLVKFVGLTKVLYPTDRFKKLYRVLVSSTSKSTLSILSAWNNFETILVQCNARFVLMPSEGNSHELFFLNRIQRYYPHVRVIMYQHAPLVTDQPGFLQVVNSLRAKDLLLLSGLSSKFVIQEKVTLDKVKCPVRIVGSSRAWTYQSTKFDNAKNRNDAPRRALFLPEGTDCAVEELVRVCNSLARIHPSVKIRIRFHPNHEPNLLIRRAVSKTLQFDSISRNSLISDLSWANEVWFRTSSTVDAALHLGLRPVHVNLNPDVDLNPIKFLGHPYLEVKSLDDIEDIYSMHSPIEIENTDSRRCFLFEEVDFAELRDICNTLNKS